MAGRDDMDAICEDGAPDPKGPVEDGEAAAAGPSIGRAQEVEETRVRLHVAPRGPETDELLSWLREAPPDAPLVVDAEAVETVCTPYVLALAAAARARAAAGRPLAVVNPGAALVDAFSDLGLFQDLMNMEFRP